MSVLIIKSTKSGLYYKKIKRALAANEIATVVSSWKLKHIVRMIKINHLTHQSTIIYARTGGYQVSRNLMWLESLGYKIFPSSKSVILTSNKYLSYLTAKGGLIKTPQTRLFLKDDLVAGIQKCLKEFGEVFIKSPLGRGNGKNCFYVDSNFSKKKITDLLERMDGKFVMVQKYIDFKYLVRVTVIGGEVDAGQITYKLSKGKHKTQMEDKVYAYTKPSQKLIELSKKIARIFGSVICIIDFLECENGQIFFNEINNASGFTKQDAVSANPMNVKIAGYLAHRHEELNSLKKVQKVPRYKNTTAILDYI